MAAPSESACFSFAMDDKYFARQGIDGLTYANRVIAVRSGREAVELHDLGVRRVGTPKIGTTSQPVDKALRTQRMFRLETDEDDHIGLVLYGMLEMMHDAPAFAHA